MKPGALALNPPRGVRVALYVVTVVGTPFVAYLNAKGILDADAVTLWSAEVAVAGSLAALNVTFPSSEPGEYEPRHGSE